MASRDDEQVHETLPEILSATSRSASCCSLAEKPEYGLRPHVGLRQG